MRSLLLILAALLATVHCLSEGLAESADTIFKQPEPQNWKLRAGKKSNWQFRTGKRGDNSWKFRTGKRAEESADDGSWLSDDIPDETINDIWRAFLAQKRDNSWKFRTGKRGDMGWQFRGGKRGGSLDWKFRGGKRSSTVVDEDDFFAP